jgi:hypothetical protein
MSTAAARTPRDVRIGGGRSTILALGSCAAFVIVAIALIAAPHGGVGAKALGVLTGVLFGSFFLLSLRVLQAGGLYVLAADGIYFPYRRWPMLPWSDVQRTRIITRWGRRFLAVDVRDADARVRQMKSGARGTRRNLRAGYGLVTIPEQMSPTSLEELQREIERRRTPRPTAEVLTDQGPTILPGSAASVQPASVGWAPGGSRALRRIAVGYAVLLVLGMLRRHQTSAPRILVLAAVVALLAGAAALHFQRSLAGALIIAAAAIFVLVLDLTAGGHIAVATRLARLFFPVCVLMVALTSWPRRRPPW